MFSSTVINPITKINTGEKRIYLAYTAPCLSLRKDKAGTQAGQELEAGIELEIKMKSLLARSPRLPYLAFLQPRDHRLRVLVFSIEVPSSRITLACASVESNSSESVVSSHGERMRNRIHALSSSGRCLYPLHHFAGLMFAVTMFKNM